jgi:dihydropteroate synthase type 2
VSVRPTLLGILNITADSFSDGGRYLVPDAALAHARSLAADGAHVIDLGAASSNPDAKPVASETEIERLTFVVSALKAEGIAVSIDSFSPVVQRWALGQHVEYVNDIAGFPHTELYPELAASGAKLIVMHSVQGGPSALRMSVPADEILNRVLRFFEGRLTALEKAGVARARLIVDPGMGFFLGAIPEASYAVLRGIAALKSAFGLPVLVSVSRKSFLRALTGRKPREAGAASLAAELFAARMGADFIRTHDPGALKDALAVTAMLDGAVRDA